LFYFVSKTRLFICLGFSEAFDLSLNLIGAIIIKLVNIRVGLGTQKIKNSIFFEIIDAMHNAMESRVSIMM
jgi:hypothetical protein